MTIGVSCPDFAAKDPLVIWKEVSEHFSHWEIFAEAYHSLDGFIDRFAETQDSYNMTYSVHAPICDVNIASHNERMREAAVLDMINNLEIASYMGASTVTIHPGIYSLAVAGLKERSVELSKRSVRLIARASKEFGVKALIENMPNFPIMLGQTPEELADIVDGTDLDICFDIGHAHTAGNIDGFLEKFKGRISNVHIHDNMGDKDSHMTIGHGNIDFKHVLSGLNGYTGNYIIESKSLESAIESKAVLEKLLS
ncbi:MAG: sugar phosphate isomerase/epimerase [Candidatus Methanoplasma sp.]|jgi:sugar phosphate isomerase/epimerase|nr:sugar phosphate isomerase/epimerase [Candidatus Methanoplasma sp.]